MYLDYAVDFTRQMMEIDSPGGFTETITERIAKEFESFGLEVHRTNKGAIYALLEGEITDKQRVISTHCDTLGAMVSKIKDNGRLRLAGIGGWACSVIEGESMRVYTDSGKVYTGTALPDKASVHIFSDDVRDIPRHEDNFEVRLDEDVKTAEDTRALGIAVGDFVCFEPHFRVTDNGYVISRFLDDKACLGQTFGVLKELCDKKIKPKYTTRFHISDFEEIGHGAYGFPPECFEHLALDIGPVGGGHQCDERAVNIVAKDSRTPYPYRFRKRLKDLAVAEGLNYTVDVHFRYGSDASLHALQGADLDFACIGPGVDGSHHIERTHKDAYVNTMALLKAYILSE